MKSPNKSPAACDQPVRLNLGGLRGAIASLLVGLLMIPALRAETVVTTGAPPGQVVQKTDPFRVITSGTVEIQATGTGIFRSGNSISLQPGFKATSGSFFQAAISSSSAVPLAWPGQTGAVRYDIYRNGVKIGDTTGTSYLDATAVANTAYTYVIKAIASGGGETVVLTLAAGTPSGFELFTPLLPSS